MQTRILIVDDDARFRALARTLLEAAGYAIVAEAADGAHALTAADRVRPDAALVDVQLPDIDGLALARHLTRDRRRPTDRSDLHRPDTGPRRPRSPKARRGGVRPQGHARRSPTSLH